MRCMLEADLPILEVQWHLQAELLQCMGEQVKYSMVDRSPETSGLLAKCKELDVTLIAHSPLSQGLLTGDDKSKLERSVAVCKLCRAMCMPLQ